jgi:hypothetical protein
MVWGKARSDRLDEAGDGLAAGVLSDVHACLKTLGERRRARVPVSSIVVWTLRLRQICFIMIICSVPKIPYQRMRGFGTRVDRALFRLNPVRRSGGRSHASAVKSLIVLQPLGGWFLSHSSIADRRCPGIRRLRASDRRDD